MAVDGASWAFLEATILDCGETFSASPTAPDKQISLTDPDARSTARSGKGTGVVGYNVRAVIDAQHHLIVAHETTNIGNDDGQLSTMARLAQAAMGASYLTAIADRGSS